MKPRVLILLIVTLVCAMVVILLPPIQQDPAYHHFGDRRTILGIANFWNVISNLPFLFVAVLGLRAFKNPHAFTEDWERRAHAVLLAATVLTALGSGYYHASPSDGTLFWDRLPMTLIFMSLLASVAGERLGIRISRAMYLLLLAFGAVALLVWKFTGDLRLYGFVQFYPAIILPLVVILFPARYTSLWGFVAMAAFYAGAKVLELKDGSIAHIIATGGHPWKHLLAAAALFCYVTMVERRTVVSPSRPTP